MCARSTRLAGSVGERAIETSLAKSSSPIDNSIARRRAVMIFDPVPRIRSGGTSKHEQGESYANDRFHGIDRLVQCFQSSDQIERLEYAASQIPGIGRYDWLHRMDNLVMYLTCKVTGGTNGKDGGHP